MNYAVKEFLEFTPPERRFDTDRLLLVFCDKSKSSGTAYLLFFFFFPVGAHHFYLARHSHAVVYPACYILLLLSNAYNLDLLVLLLALASGVIWLIDLVFLSNWVYDHNRDLIHRLNDELLRERDAEPVDPMNPGPNAGATG